MSAEAVQRDGGRPPAAVIRDMDTRNEREQIARVPQVFRAAIRDVYRRAYASDRMAANHELLAVAGGVERRLSEAKTSPRAAADDGVIRRTARRAAEAAHDARKRSVGMGDAWDTMAKVCRYHGIEPSEAGKDATTEAGALARMECRKWWTRRLRRTRARAVEGAGILAGMVGDGANRARYASGFAVTRKRQQDEDNAAALEAARAICDSTGEEVRLSKIIESTLANPRIKRGELMTRVRGFDEVATARGHVGEFLTITCPSRFHRWRGDQSNPKYNGATPREAQHYLRDVWAKIRAEWNKAGIRPYGLRVAEPHRDACPHWHLLIFIPESQADEACAIAERLACAEDHDEIASNHAPRFKRETIDRNRGSAAGYVAKYVAKAIDGTGGHNDRDLLGTMSEDSIAEAAERIRAWASTWGIRQFQQVGGPPVTVWRELRRMDADTGIRPAAIEGARIEADAGRWAGFVEAMGGPEAERKDMPVTLRRHAGEGERDGYGDPARPRILGLDCEGAHVPTRVKVWRIEIGGQQEPADKIPKNDALNVAGEPAAQRPGADFGSAQRDPWTRGSNCNHGATGTTTTGGFRPWFFYRPHSRPGLREPAGGSYFVNGWKISNDRNRWRVIRGAA